MKNNYLRVFICIAIAFFFIVSPHLHSQDLLESRQTSPFTYICKITDKEAKTIYKKSIWEVDTSFFHTLVDSFETRKYYSERLPRGHYLKTWADKGIQRLAITSIHDFEVLIMNNNTDLCIQVFDKEGNIISDADLKIRWKRLRYDKNRQAYIDKKSNQQGILTVTWNGLTSYHQLERDYNNSTIKRAARKTFYHLYPVRYAWKPVNFIIHIPIDGVKSIVKGWPVGTISRASRFFVNAYERVACHFTYRDCDSYRRKSRQNAGGYIVFNKPKYLPGDTVKVKAFLLNKKNKPLTGEVKAELLGRGPRFPLGILNPYREGAYAFEFVLHDSLQLKLDSYYTLNLESIQKRERYFSRANFFYEDYELSKINLDLRTGKKRYFKGQEIKLFAKGTDENELNLMDGRLEVVVLPQTVLNYFDDYQFIPDTLFSIKQKLEPSGETEINIPDSIFSQMNLNCHVKVKLLTSDNQTVEASENFQFFHWLEEIDFEVLADSVRFTLRENGLGVEEETEIVGLDRMGNETVVYSGFLPCAIPLNPYFGAYMLKKGRFKDYRYSVDDEAPMLNCYSERKRDSLFILVDNPRSIPFSYHIYKKNKLVDSGYGKTLDFRKKSISKKNYFISLSYLWKGYQRQEDYRIPLLDKKLEVEVEQPKIVFPGQKTEIKIKVADQKGKPVEGVDLTAFGLTSKFDYRPPALAYLGKTRKNKEVINNFDLDDNPAQPGELPLDYNAWNNLSRFDSIEFYKFLYPEKGLYQFEYVPEDSITQFAPFVVNKGKQEPIHVIYVDSKPVYFSWSTHAQPYSFKVKSGIHQIRLRTNTRDIFLDKFYFPAGKKLIFSFEMDTPVKDVRWNEVEPTLSPFEKNILYQYIFPYQYIYGDKFAYIIQGDNVQLLKPGSQNWTARYFAGPVIGKATFKLLDEYSTDFVHDPFYVYRFTPNLLKMKSISEDLYPSALKGYPMKTSFTDLVVTEETIRKNWLDILNMRSFHTRSWSENRKQRKDTGKLRISLDHKLLPKKEGTNNVLVFKHEDPEFLRIYPGNSYEFENLEEGFYKVIYLYRDSDYFVCDSTFVRPNGTNYYKFDSIALVEKDSFSIKVLDIIRNFQWSGKAYYYKNKMNKEIRELHRDEFTFTGKGRIIEGHIYDQETGEPMMGVTVYVQGTSYGTVTDFNGYYTLNVPLENNVLEFSYLGYISDRQTIDNSDIIDIGLSESNVMLEEVTISALGLTASKKSIGYAASEVESQDARKAIPELESRLISALSGKVAGITVVDKQGGPGAGVEISIRGAETISFDQQPLYIIDGVVFLGDISKVSVEEIEKMDVLKNSEEAIAIYGARAANGVVIITTKDGRFANINPLRDKGADYDETFLEAASQSSSIRDNFSDYAFWQPKLITDREGRASFTVTFPDDITSWNTHVLAMNEKKQTGQTSGLIKSYKPLMSRLAIPRFLVEGDSTYAIGKTLNYMPDSVELTTHFEINDQIQQTRKQTILDAAIDTLTIIGRTDTLSVKYYLENEEGYFDGEQRNIPVFPIGLERTEGAFYTLDRDTLLKLDFDPALGEVTLTARASEIEVIQEEIGYLTRYKYDCNEQLASKLKAWLALKKIAIHQEQAFEGQEHILKIIKLLQKRQIKNDLWGWWGNSTQSLWISMHVVETLAEAESMGYNTGIEKDKLAEMLVLKLETLRNLRDKVRYLKILHLLNDNISPEIYIKDIEKDQHLSVNDLFQVIHLRQVYDLDYNLDTLDHFQKTTHWGNIYFADTNINSRYAFWYGDQSTTLLAYKILKADSLDHSETLRKIRNYFFEKRSNGRWGNTYLSSRIIETIYPDLLGGEEALQFPELMLKGESEIVIDSFPYELVVQPKQNLELIKRGDIPVYFSASQTFWDNNPEAKGKDFEIVSRFGADSTQVLTAGVPVKLEVELKAKKESRYVMVNIPIPAGCSYGEKKNGHWRESHREYFKNETAIFFAYLPEGEYHFEIELIPRFSGTYTLNPAKAELMYFPIFNGNNGLKGIRIEE